MDAREALKTLTETLQNGEYSSPSYALGYVESLFASVIESLPKTQQKRVISEIQYHISCRKSN